MKKKIALLFITAAFVCSLTACGSGKCKADGCDEKTYKEGYCEEHYFLSQLEKGIDELGKNLLN